MSDQPTLRVEARGPVRAIREPDADMAVQIEERPEIEAVFSVSAFEFANIGDVCRAGLVLTKKQVAEHVVDALQSNEAALYSVAERGAWRVSVTATVDEYQQVALAAARNRRSPESAAEETAAHLLNDLAADFASSERPLLALYDLLRERDPDVDMTPESVLKELSSGALTERGDDAAEVEA